MDRIRRVLQYATRRWGPFLIGGFLFVWIGVEAWAQLQCATCHPQIAASFAKTGMGRSFYKPDERIVPAAEPYFHAASGTWYAMERNAAGSLVQRRWRVDKDGKPVHARELSVDYVMGSGDHARSFLHRTPRGGLLELPLAWYAENGGTWALSPGNDREYSLPPRAIAYECMFCHNRYPAIPAGYEEPGTEPLYRGPLPQGIDCQRCHGNGATHITKAQSGEPLDEVRGAIMNPAKLSKERQMEVCMQCHLQTTSLPLPHSILRLGRGPFSYNPAEPLGDFMRFYDFAAGTPNQEDFEIAQSAYRLRKSKCFLRSEGKMTCTTCHNPHEAGSKSTSYNATCSGCHSSASLQAVEHPVGNGDCVSCHMPKRRTRDVIHVVMTDHLIQRRLPAENLLAAIPERQEQLYQGPVVPYYPKTADLIIDAIAQVSGKRNLSFGLAQLEAAIAKLRPDRGEPYIELGQAYVAANQLPKALRALEEAVTRKPQSVPALLSLADVLTQSGQAGRAGTMLERALKLAPDEPLLWYQMSIAQGKAGAPERAEAALAKAIELDPDLAEARNSMGEMLAGRGDIAAAEREFEAALRINPDLPEALANLGQLLGLRGQMDAAIGYLARAVKLNGADVNARVNLAVTLASMKRLDEAEVQIQAVLQRNSSMANAHYVKGAILEMQGREEFALRAYLDAVLLEPTYKKAHLAAARLLEKRGDLAGAASHRRSAQ